MVFGFGLETETFLGGFERLCIVYKVKPFLTQIQKSKLKFNTRFMEIRWSGGGGGTSLIGASSLCEPWFTGSRGKKCKLDSHFF